MRPLDSAPPNPMGTRFRAPVVAGPTRVSASGAAVGLAPPHLAVRLVIYQSRSETWTSCAGLSQIDAPDASHVIRMRSMVASGGGSGIVNQPRHPPRASPR
jgi:hypothetical protein